MSLPFKRILCPVDFDESAEAVLRLAGQIAAEKQAVVYLLHVVPQMVAPIQLPPYAEIAKGQEDTARRTLAVLGRRLLVAVDYEILIRSGEPAPEILDAEKQVSPDVVVMATHGRRGISRMFLGSVAEAVVRGSACAVMTVHPEAEHGDHAAAG
jgi:universal stress protein A